MSLHGGFTNVSDFAKSAGSESPTGKKACPCRNYSCGRAELAAMNFGAAGALDACGAAAAWPDEALAALSATVLVEATPTAIPPMAMTNPPKIYARKVAFSFIGHGRNSSMPERRRAANQFTHFQTSRRGTREIRVSVHDRMRRSGAGPGYADE